MQNLVFVCGAFIYSYNDNNKCYVCGHEDCPIETGWGLVDENYNPRPLYYAVQKAFGEWY